MKTPVAQGRPGPVADPAAARVLHGGTLKPLARQIRVALVLGLAAGSAFAGPQGGQVVAGQGQIAAPDALTTRITQQSANLAIDWQSFNVKSNELVEFRQPGRDAQALNRIFDQNPSQIFGRLNANGRVLLMNPNGIVFGPGAQVNVGSLVAAGMRVKVDDFMAGQLHLEGVDGTDGVVVNQGLIAAATGGDVTLVGKAVRNEGLIVATAGRVNLAAGDKVTLDFDGDGLVRFTVDEGVLSNAKALDSAVSNTGTISADGGTVMIAARTAADVFSHTVNNGGAIRAARVDSSGGVIKLVGSGPDASVLNTGTIDASAAGSGDGGRIEIDADGRTTLAGGGVVSASGGAGGKGGEVRVLGATVELADQARVDVSGPAGGGTALVGGDRGGSNPDVRNAGTTSVAADVRISASATAAGDGGKVIVWSNGLTTMLGRIDARGGELGGNGGFVETSGHHLLLRGHADLRAPLGKGGTMLLDPATITVISGADGAEVLPDVYTDGFINAQLGLGGGLLIDAGTGTGADGVNDDITFNNNVAISWTTSSFNLVASRNVSLGGAINGGAGTSFRVDFGQGGVAGNLSLGNVTLGGGMTVLMNGGTGTNTITGGASGSTFTPSSSTAGTITGSGLAIPYTTVTKLTGTAAADTFNINVNLAAGTTLTGGGGNDTFNLASGVTVADPIAGGGSAKVNGPNAATTWTITGAGSVNVSVGATASFTGVGTLNGGNAADTFKFQNGTSVNALTLTDTGGTNVLDLSAEAGNLTVAIGTPGGGTVGGVTFSSIATIDTGGGDDAFDFTGTGTLAGSIDGGAGSNRIDYSGRAAVVATVDLQAATLSPLLGGTFAGISGFVGNGANSTLRAPDGGATVNVTAPDAGNVNGTTTFSGFTTLKGGTGNDSFVFANNATVPTVQGNGGTDTLDLSAYLGGQTFSISGSNSGSVNGIAFSAISNVVGTAGGDTFNFGASGVLANLNGGGGADTLDVSAIVTAETVDLQAHTITTGLTGTFTAIQSFIGKSTSDTIVAPDGGVTIATTAPNSGTITGGFTFTTFHNITGGSGADVIQINHNVAGTVNGAGGDDNISVGSGVTIGAINGGTGTNTLTGPNAANTWVLTGAGSGTLDGQSFSNIQNLTGGNTDDSFAFNGGSITGTLDAGAGGTNTLDYTSDAGAITVNLGAATATRTGGIANVGTIVGNNSNTTLIGTAGDDVFAVTTNNAGTVGAITFSKVTSLGGGTGGNDSFTLSTGVVLSGSLTGGPGTSAFVLGDNASVTGIVDGGAGAATLSFAAYSTPRTITLDGTGTSHGFKGHEAAINGGAANGFDNIDTLVGGTSSTDTLTGLAAVSTWNLGLTNTYVSTNTLTFSAIENLTAGGAGANTFNVSQNHTGTLTGAGGDDQFVFTGSAVLTGAVAGGTGNDTLSFAGYGSSVAVTAKGGSGKGDVSGVPDPIVSGTDDFTGVETVIGATTITAPNGQTNNWNVTGVDAFTLNGTAYTGVHQVVGGDQVDNFTIQNLGQLTGVTGIDGGAGANTLTVAAASSISITANNTGTVTTGAGPTTFTNIGTFTGSAGADTFALSGTATVTSISGGGGVDTLDWSAYNTARTITITSVGANGATGTEASITGGFTDIGILKGKTGAANQLTGPNVTSAWVIGGGVDDNTDDGTVTTAGGTFTFVNVPVLVGGSGDDTVTISGGRLSPGGSIDGGAAATRDTLRGDNTANTWDLSAGSSVTNLNGTVPFSGFENLTGGNTDDTFRFNGGTVAGNVNGGAAGGTNTLDYSLLATPVAVDLGAGTASAVGGTFAGITNLIGNGANTTLTGPSAGPKTYSFVMDLGAGSGQVKDGLTVVIGFAAVGTLQGSSAAGVTNTLDLSAEVAPRIITIDQTNGGSVDTATPLAFTGMQNVTAGAGNDTFLFTGSGNLTGTANGGGGALNTFDFSGAASVVTVNLGSLLNIQNLVGSAGTDTLVASNAGDTFNITANGAGNVNGAITFTSFEKVQGGPGTDTLDWSAFATSRQVTITTLDANGAAGTDGPVPSLSGGFTNIEVIRNTAGAAGQLTGPNAVNTWTLTAANAGKLEGGGGTLNFTDFTTLVGGGTPANDTLIAGATANAWNLSSTTAGTLATLGGSFTFSAMGHLVGNAGDDAFTIPVAETSLNGTTLDGGAAGTNTVVFQGAGVTVDLGLLSNVTSIDVTGGGTNTLLAGAAATKFKVTDLNAGQIFTGAGFLTAGPTFTHFQNLAGAAGNDVFAFVSVGAVHGYISGSVDGGGGSNTIDFSASTLAQRYIVGPGANQGRISDDPFVSTPPDVDLMDPVAGFTNVQTVTGNGLGAIYGPDANLQPNTIWKITGTNSGTFGPTTGNENVFNNFLIVGGTSNDDFRIAGGQMIGGVRGGGGTNKVTGQNGTTNDWTITGTDSGTVTTGANSTSFVEIQTLVGGDQTDNFHLNTSFGGNIDGGAGTNTLNGPNVPTTWTLTGAASGTVSNVAGGFVNITNIVAGAAADLFTVVGASLFNGSIDGGGGVNTFTGGDVANTWNLTGAGQGNIGGKSAFTNITGLVGGSQDDTFRFSNGSTFATLDGGGGTNRLDYSAVTGPIHVDLNAGTTDLITTPGGATNFQALTGTASPADTLVGRDIANTWTLTALNQGSVNGFAFTGIENLQGGAGTDRFVLTAAGKLVGGSIDGGAGTDEIVGQNVASVWNITGPDAGTMNTNVFTGIENLTAQGANATLAFAAAASLTGTFSAPQITLATANINTGGSALNLQGDVVSAGAQSVNAGAISLTGNLTSGGSLTLTSAAAPISISGTLTSAGGLAVVTGGGNFSLGGALSTNGTTGITSGAGSIVVGGSVDTHGGAFNALASTGGGNALTVGGLITAGSVDVASSNSSLGVVTTTGTQHYAGSTTLGGDLTGGNLEFDGIVNIATDVLLESGTNTFTFNGAVLGNGSLDINPTSGTNLFIDTTAGAEHISSTAFSGYHGHLIIGGILTPRTGPAENAAVTEINADRITLDSAFSTHGDVTLLASNIDLLADLTATGGQVTMLAVGNTQGKGTASGDITGPTSGTVAITADKAVLIANNQIANNQNIRLDLGGGPVLVAVSTTVQQPTFDPGSVAVSETFDPTALKIISSLTNPIGVQAVQVVFSNPAAALTGLQNVQFVDVGIFEQDLTLFGVLGNGIALSLDQCEEKDGCAPNITAEQIGERIADLKERIKALEIHGDKGDRLASLRRQLSNLETYQQQLHDYQEAQESRDRFEEIDESALGGEKGKAAAPAAPEERLEEVQKPATSAPKAPAPKPALAPPAAKPAEFEELDETLDDKSKPAAVKPGTTAPAVKPEKPVQPKAAPQAPAKPAGKPADNPNEFEELEEEIDDSMILSLAGNLPEARRGAIGLDTAGRVRWQGELALPAAHARY